MLEVPYLELFVRFLLILVHAMFIVKQWQLKEGDKLDWQIEARNNEVVLVVRKAGETITHTVVPAEDVRKEMEKQKRVTKKNRFDRITTS